MQLWDYLLLNRSAGEMMYTSRIPSLLSPPNQLNLTVFTVTIFGNVKSNLTFPFPLLQYSVYNLAVSVLTRLISIILK